MTTAQGLAVGCFAETRSPEASSPTRMVRGFRIWARAKRLPDHLVGRAPTATTLAGDPEVVGEQGDDSLAGPAPPGTAGDHLPLTSASQNSASRDTEL